jgi:hypothetical protein
LKLGCYWDRFGKRNDLLFLLENGSSCTNVSFNYPHASHLVTRICVGCSAEVKYVELATRLPLVWKNLLHPRLQLNRTDIDKINLMLAERKTNGMLGTFKAYILSTFAASHSRILSTNRTQ